MQLKSAMRTCVRIPNQLLSKKLLLIMNFTAFFLLLACLQLSARGNAQTVTLSMKNAPLQEVFSSIKKQTGYSFIWDEADIKNAAPVTIEVKNASIENVLAKTLHGQRLDYKIIGKLIVIKPKPSVSSSETSAQEAALAKTNPIDVHGRIVNEKGEPVIASVQVKGTNRGTTTNDDGEFELKAIDDDAVLLISGISIESFQISVKGKTELTLNARLKIIKEEDITVSTGYWTTTRRLSTGNIAKITSEEIEKQPVMNPLQALQGRVPGLSVIQTSGYASAPFRVELRGRNNITNAFTSDPLYIIDGVPLTVIELTNNTGYGTGSPGFLQNVMSNPANGQSPFFSIDPNDIESIEVLKDADATSIYGSRAANGVIIITTKKGKAGKIKVTAGINYGISKITRNWSLLNTQQYLQLRNEALKNDGLSPDPFMDYDLVSWDTTRYTDWQKFLWGGTGRTTNSKVAISGGSNQVSFRLSTGYDRRTDNSSVSGSDERGAVSFALGCKTDNDRFSLAFSNTYSFSKNNIIALPVGTAAVLSAPNAPGIFNSDGKPNYADWQLVSNYPFTSLFQPYTSKTNFLNSNLNLNLQLVRGLSIGTRLGYNTTNVNQTFISPISSLDPATSPTGASQFGTNDIKNWIVEPQLEYNVTFLKGRLNTTFGASLQSNTTDGVTMAGSGYNSDLLLNTISAAPNKDASELFGQYKYSAAYGRVNYVLKDKYIINFSGRRDGSSRFGEGKQFGNFGAVGAAWIFSDEPFFKHSVSFLSFGKLRGSYGTSGSDAVGEYKFLTRWSSNGAAPYGGAGTIMPIQHANNQYHWSENKKLEAAVDLGLFNDRLSLSVAWYRNRCNDQLIEMPLGLLTGFPTVTANSPAFVQNTGWEASLMGKAIDKKDFSWIITFNTSINHNKLLSYPNLSLSTDVNRLVVGKSLNIERVLHYTGVDPQTGLYTFEDRNKDGNITVSNGADDDRYLIEIGPRLMGGWGNIFRYKGIELSLFFNLVKQTGINAFYNGAFSPGSSNYNISDYVFNNLWRKPGDNSKFAKATTMSYLDQGYTNFMNSDGIYADASYIRLANLSLTYNLPANLLKKARLQGVQVTVTGQNLFVITKYKGIDPETQNFGGMPPAKVLMGGINFNF
jgi:TonB-linked SusC/RagA family outer membrane protein